MKVYVLKDEDFEKLFAEIDRDPKHGGGGSSQVLTKEEQEAHDKAHRRFNYVVRKWASEVRS